MEIQADLNYSAIYDWKNLYHAFRKAAKGKRYHASAAQFIFRLEDNLVQLQDELASGNYRRKLKWLVSKFRQGDITRDALQSSLQGWVNHVSYGDTCGLRRAIYKEIFYE